ncbi:MAG TPA: Vms1/Ankzf1 family peptidyl-tRNA hydrolase [Gaiellaceae bacterium]
MTRDDLRELAGFRSATGGAFSLYLDLDPSTTPTQADAETRLRSLLDRGEKEAAAESDLDRILTWWNDEFDRDGSHGVAIFVSSADDLWRVLLLPGSVRDDVHVGRELRIAPLLDYGGDTESSFVAVVSRERGQVYRLRAGRLEEVVDRSEEQPGQHGQGGWAQARFQRHIDKLVADHLKELGGEIDKRVRRVDGPQLVIVAPEELRGEIESALSQETRDAIVGWASAEAHAGPNEVLEVVQPLLDHAHVARMQEALERFREERGRNGRACDGWEDTLAAASDGRVDLLVLGERNGHSAYQCPECGRAQADAGSCPLDGTALEPADASELAVHQTLTHGGAVVHVPRVDLDGAEVGALLRF